MGFVESVRTCSAKTFVWEGRASRSEFWWFALASFFAGLAVVLLALFVTRLTGSHAAGQGVTWLGRIAVYLPGLAVTIRRLHDTGRNGAWYWIGFIPFIGGIVLLIFMLLPSEPGMNAYGPHPYDRDPYPVRPSTPVTAFQGPKATGGSYWCANKNCQMHNVSVDRETCIGCGEPTRRAEPAMTEHDPDPLRPPRPRPARRPAATTTSERRYWCANTACPMHSISVDRETCVGCGEPTRTAEPA